MTSREESQEPLNNQEPESKSPPSFQNWHDANYDDDGDYGGHISERMIRRWRYDEKYGKGK